MAKTGYLVIIYQDINPSSPTYNQTREERLQDETNCPYRGEANWIEDTKYCELTDNGMLTGYEITVYRDVEPLSSTYNQTREERELNTTECEADSSLPNWQNIGEPFCRQTVYLPGGLMGNDGYMIQQQQDMNEYSETADEIRDVETLDLENCPLPNTEPVWQTISESCHLVTFNGQLVYDGTKDVIRVNTNQYSPSWNNNIPETANIEDEINCPSGIEKQYRWVAIEGSFSCVGYDKYEQLKKQESIDGVNWTDVVPLETMQGDLIERNSTDCGYIEPQYRWVVISSAFVCVGYDKHQQEKQQVSYDNGTTWEDVVPSNTRTGLLIEANSTDCGYEPTVEYRWVVIDGQYECVGYDKHAVEKKQQSIDGGSWTDVVPTETRTGSIIEYNSEDCGYVPPKPSIYSTMYLTFEALQNGTFTFRGKNNNSLSYSLDDGQTWTSLASGAASPTITTGNKIMWKGTCTPDSGGSGSFSSTGTFKAYGNIMSIVYGDDFKNSTVINNTHFSSLFMGTKVVNAENLVLPSTTLASYCYYYMFQGCRNLITAPELPATTLAKSCYYNMFAGCTSLTTAPELPATTLAEACYFGMFQNCPLVNAPVLPATTLATECYNAMFEGCTSLTTAPELPATELAAYCYLSMFRDCTSLVNAPVLPATTLKNRCYGEMFRGCTSLVNAPVLPATTLGAYCYVSMFRDCSNLSYIKAMFTTTPNDTYTGNWVSGVSSTGTFVKNSAATWDVTGVNGIPSGWTVETANA